MRGWSYYMHIFPQECQCFKESTIHTVGYIFSMEMCLHLYTATQPSTHISISFLFWTSAVSRSSFLHRAVLLEKAVLKNIPATSILLDFSSQPIASVSLSCWFVQHLCWRSLQQSGVGPWGPHREAHRETSCVPSAVTLGKAQHLMTMLCCARCYEINITSETWSHFGSQVNDSKGFMGDFPWF